MSQLAVKETKTIWKASDGREYSSAENAESASMNHFIKRGVQNGHTFEALLRMAHLDAVEWILKHVAQQAKMLEERKQEAILPNLTDKELNSIFIKESGNISAAERVILGLHAAGYKLVKR